jgi:hypothetical protein
VEEGKNYAGKLPLCALAFDLRGCESISCSLRRVEHHIAPQLYATLTRYTTVSKIISSSSYLSSNLCARQPSLNGVSIHSTPIVERYPVGHEIITRTKSCPACPSPNAPLQGTPIVRRSLASLSDLEERTDCPCGWLLDTP